VSPLSQKMTGIGEPLPALGSITENFIVHPSTALACSYLHGADAQKRGEITVRVSRGGIERCQVSACCGVKRLLRIAPAFCRRTHWFTLAPNAFLLSFTAAIEVSFAVFLCAKFVPQKTAKLEGSHKWQR